MMTRVTTIKWKLIAKIIKYTEFKIENLLTMHNFWKNNNKL